MIAEEAPLGGTVREGGADFRVWAPRAEAAWLVLDGRRLPMRRGDDGEWRASVDGARAGARYAFDVGGGPRPDPATRAQPDGVHGPSALVDPRAFDIRPGPGRAAREEIFYEVHVGAFTREGTLDAAAAALEDVARLGATAVELMPLSPFPGDRGWGYDGVAPGAVHAAYGGPAALARFVDRAHALGLAVAIDLVLNHLGPDGNYLAQLAPYFTHEVNTPWGDGFDYANPQVRRWAGELARRFRVEYRADYLRLDAVHAIVDLSPTHLVAELARLGGVIAESDLNDPVVVARDGWGCDAQWSDDLHHALHALLTGERQGYYEDFGGVEHLATALRRGFVYAGELSSFRGRPHGKAPRGTPPRKLVVAAQNHDQVGNRARGERLSQLVPRAALEAAAATVLLSGNVPLLFMGEEWGASTPFLYFTSHTDAALARAISEGRRREFAKFSWAGEVPDPQAASSFEASRLVREERSQGEHAALFAWHRELIALRKRSGLARGLDEAPEVATLAGARALAWRAAELLVVVSYQPEPATVVVPCAGPWTPVLSSDGSKLAPGEHGELLLPGYGVRVYSGPARSVSMTIS